MGKRQNKLLDILSSDFSMAIPTIDKNKVFYQSEFNHEIQKTYKRLGGCLDFYPVNFGSFDIVTSDYVLELDEEAHFNRYRSITLESSIYGQLTGFPLTEYKKYCSEYETNCIREAGWGNFWTAVVPERQFGISDSPKDFSDNGSSRWKQRAFYDYLKDVLAVLGLIRLIRISVYDMVDSNSINQILKNEIPFNSDSIKKLILNRL